MYPYKLRKQKWVKVTYVEWEFEEKNNLIINIQWYEKKKEREKKKVKSTFFSFILFHSFRFPIIINIKKKQHIFNIGIKKKEKGIEMADWIEKKKNR